VQPRLFVQIDGPMLTRGLKAMAGARPHTPRAKAAQPDEDRLEVRSHDVRAAN
jgi:hypothetical protein